ncbi:phage virion morphogenesis (putative tail completion) protein [Devosia enhydra]|uniref:Phage virion morphogenesis (Putative tail completion) protein n=1 Tax=Devosia enhydra TaxID=665118 RepID=A0A1K2I104_9HYPH|nr:phage virion morphogenesis protein [Devosia enhydra]SFZ86000.1 phage virion morphogenesis (putative tail completion) protein [Devosia enhydra]
MARIEITVPAADAASAALRRAAARLEDARPLYDEIGRSLTVSTQQRFATERAPDGSPWPSSIRALVSGGKTLTDSARLRNSITWEPASDRVAVGTNVIYAAVHQFGAVIRPVRAAALRFRIPGIGWVTRKSVTIPRRAFLGLDQDDQTMIAQIAVQFVLTSLQETAGV